MDFEVIPEVAAGLDVFRPTPSRALGAAVLVLHGGGLRFGHRKDTHAACRALAAEGLVAAAVGYRLVTDAPWPAALTDVVTAIRWARANAERLSVAPDRIALEGMSAGGLLALLAASDPEANERPNAIVALFAPTEFTAGKTANPLQSVQAVFGQEAADETMARELSPIHRISPGFPPTFIIHGTADWVVSHQESQRLFNALVAAQVSTELHIFPEHHHEFQSLPSMTGPVHREIARFLQQVLIAPEVSRQEIADKSIFSGGPALVQERLNRARP